MKQAITSSLSHEHIQFLKLVLNRLPLRALYTLNPLRVGLRAILILTGRKLSGNKINSLSTVNNGNVHTMEPAGTLLVGKNEWRFSSPVFLRQMEVETLH